MARILGSVDTVTRIRATKETMNQRKNILSQLDADVLKSNKISWKSDGSYELIPKQKRGRKPTGFALTRNTINEEIHNSIDADNITVLEESTIIRFRKNYFSKNPHRGNFMVIHCTPNVVDVIDNKGKEFSIGDWKNKIEIEIK